MPKISSRSPDAAWVLQSDRGITYTNEVPAGSRVVEGKWWSADYDGPPLVSFEKKIADGLGLKVGDEIVVNALGRDVTARIANLRELDWQSLGINFVLVYSPGTFRGAPVMHIATLTYPGGGTAAEEAAMLKGVSQEFPVSDDSAGQGRARCGRRAGRQSGARRARRQRDHADRSGARAGRRAGGRPSPPGL